MFTNQVAASADSIVRGSNEGDSSADVRAEKKSIDKDGNPSTGVDSTGVNESNVAVDGVLNEDWSDPAKTAQVDSEQSISP